ncbi:MAG: hypothetical protein EA425_06960 [Puniceicoccaceae bacterium]|nr:MAG: hypothetical protein EA425_06960 [Puniceicoccaceae bacterium]
MSGPLVHVSAAINCPHGGPVTVVPAQTRVLASGQPVATLADQYLVAGCAFTLPGGKPQPCMRVQWLVPASRVLVNGAPAILQGSSGLCLSAEQIPQGPPIVAATQPRVLGV